MTSIREVMTKDPTTLREGASVAEAATLMKTQDIGNIIVMDDSGQVAGILTDRDIVIRAVAENRSTAETTVGDICTRDLTTLSPDDNVGAAVRMMTDKAIRRLPVVEGGKPVGIVSIGDLAVDKDSDSALADISAAPPNN